MAKIKNNYENSWWPRFTKWLKGGSSKLEQEMVSEFSESAAPHQVISQEEALRREIEADERQRLNAVTGQLISSRMHTWTRTRGAKLTRWLYGLLAVVICFSIIFALLSTVSYLPPFGDPNNPINNEVTQRYIEKGLQETGAVNIVTGMILDYRAFDTLGESNVLFIAACSVLILLRVSQEKKEDGSVSQEKLAAEADDRVYEPKNDLILQRVAIFVVPMILLFGIYVILNGHISPGGGFSGGAIMGAGLILYLNAFGFEKTERFFTFKTFQTISFISLAFYALSKAYSFFCGANHLDSGIGLGTPGAIFSAGLILYLNIAVGMVVCCTMYAFYTLFRKGDM